MQTLRYLLLMLLASPLAAEEMRDGIFIHLSHGADAPQRVSMALTLAAIYAPEHPVLIYADISAVHLFLREAPSVEHPAYAETQELLARLREHEVTIMVCPSCLRAAGKRAENLAEGIQIADKSRFLTFTSGRILSFSY